MDVVSGAGAFEIEVDGQLLLDSAAAGTVGHIHVNSGGYMLASATWIDRLEIREGGTATLTSGTHVEIVEVRSGASCIVRSASIASADVSSGGTLGLVNGTSTETFLHSGGVMTKAGRCKIHYQSISEVGGAVFKDYGDVEED